MRTHLKRQNRGEAFEVAPGKTIQQLIITKCVSNRKTEVFWIVLD